MQLSYLSKSDYDMVDDFFIISVTEVRANPFKGYNISDKLDLIGNMLKREILT